MLDVNRRAEAQIKNFMGDLNEAEANRANNRQAIDVERMRTNLTFQEELKALNNTTKDPNTKVTTNKVIRLLERSETKLPYVNEGSRGQRLEQIRNVRELMEEALDLLENSEFKLEKSEEETRPEQEKVESSDKEKEQTKRKSKSSKSKKTEAEKKIKPVEDEVRDQKAQWYADEIAEGNYVANIVVEHLNNNNMMNEREYELIQKKLDKKKKEARPLNLIKKGLSRAVIGSVKKIDRTLENSKDNSKVGRFYSRRKRDVKDTALLASGIVNSAIDGINNTIQTGVEVVQNLPPVRSATRNYRRVTGAVDEVKQGAKRTVNKINNLGAVKATKNTYKTLTSGLGGGVRGAAGLGATGFLLAGPAGGLVGAAAGTVAGATQGVINKVLNDPKFLADSNFANNLRANHRYRAIKDGALEQINQRVKNGGVLNTRLASTVKGAGKVFGLAPTGAAIGSLFGPVGTIAGTAIGAGAGIGIQLAGDSISNAIHSRLITNNIDLTMLKNIPGDSVFGVIEGNNWLNTQADLIVNDWLGIDRNIGSVTRGVYGWGNAYSTAFNMFNAGMFGLESYTFYKGMLSGGAKTLAQIGKKFLFSKSLLSRLNNRFSFVGGGALIGATLGGQFGLIGAGLGGALGAGVGYGAHVGLANIANLSKVGAGTLTASSIIGGTAGSIAASALAAQLGLPLGAAAAIGGAIGGTVGAALGAAVGTKIAIATGGAGTFIIPIASNVGAAIGNFVGSLGGAFVDRLLSSIIPAIPNPLSFVTGAFAFFKFFTEEMRSIADYSKIAVASLSIIGFLTAVTEVYDPLENSDQGCSDVQAEECSEAANASLNRNLLYYADQIDYRDSGAEMQMQNNYTFTGVEVIEEFSETELLVKGRNKAMLINNPGNYIFEKTTGRLVGKTNNARVALFNINTDNLNNTSAPEVAGIATDNELEAVSQASFCELDSTACE